MSPPSLSECGRFVVLNSLHLDRNIFEALARWAAERGIGVQDAFQLALSYFNDQQTAALPAGGVVRVHDVGFRLPPVLRDVRADAQPRPHEQWQGPSRWPRTASALQRAER